MLGYLINREAFLRIELIGMIACFIGVVLMAVSEEDELSYENTQGPFM